MNERKLIRLIKAYGDHCYREGYEAERDHQEMINCRDSANHCMKLIRAEIRKTAAQAQKKEV